jgi:putative transposase
VRREADRWYVSLTVETERPDPEPILGPVTGVDLGLSSFAAISDGVREEAMAAPKPLGRSLRLLRRRSRVHSRIRNVRTDFLHKLSTHLAKTKSVVVLEDLNVQGMVRNRRLARPIADAGWSSFRRMLEYKSRWYGSKVVVAPRFLASSKTCSECGRVLPSLALSVRKWVCPACGVEHDRDGNAARNLVAWYRLATGSSPGSDACGEPSGGAEAYAAASHGSAKQESAVEDVSMAEERSKRWS